MLLFEVVQCYFLVVVDEVEVVGFGYEFVCWVLLGLVILKYLEMRLVVDIQVELCFIVENCDFDIDFMFMCL